MKMAPNISVVQRTRTIRTVAEKRDSRIEIFEEPEESGSDEFCDERDKNKAPLGPIIRLGESCLHSIIVSALDS